MLFDNAVLLHIFEPLLVKVIKARETLIDRQLLGLDDADLVVGGNCDRLVLERRGVIVCLGWRFAQLAHFEVGKGLSARERLFLQQILLRVLYDRLRYFLDLPLLPGDGFGLW